jgi:hypothetical protein
LLPSNAGNGGIPPKTLAKKNIYNNNNNNKKRKKKKKKINAQSTHATSVKRARYLLRLGIWAGLPRRTPRQGQYSSQCPLALDHILASARETER